MVVQDERLNRNMVVLHRGEFLDVHIESAITNDTHHIVGAWVSQACAQSTGKREPHWAIPIIGDEALPLFCPECL